MNRHRAGAAVLWCWIMLFGGCAGDEPPEERAFTVRLLTTPNLSGRWERAAERGLGLVAAELGAEVTRRRLVDGTDERWNVVGDEAGEGVDLVFCVGGGFEKALYAEAGSHPGTVFVLLPGRARADNVAGIEFLPDGAGYLAGVVAASLTSARRVGVLRGTGKPWLEALENGFASGFRARRRRAEIETVQGVEGVWALNVTDVEMALYASDEPEAAVVEAAREAGLKLIVTDPALMREMPKIAVAAVEVKVAEAMLRVAREVRDGSFVGRAYSFDLGSGILEVSLNQDLDPEVAVAATDALETARAEVTAGLVEFDRLGL